VRLDRLITLMLVRPLRALGSLFSCTSRLASLASDRVLPILMYHSISDDAEAGVHPYYRVCTSPRRFAEQIQWFKQAGYRGVTLCEGLAWLRGISPLRAGRGEGQGDVSRPSPSSDLPPSSQRVVAITFDDGFQDFYATAWPILREHGFAATVYLPTAFIGEQRRRFAPSTSHLPVQRECLTWSEVRELHAAGIEFGSHTVAHPKLVELSWPQIERELRSSKLELEQELAATVRCFAHPYAYPSPHSCYANSFESLLAEVGYTTNVTTLIGREVASFNPFRLRRLPVNGADDRALLLAKLRGDYDWLGSAQQCFKQSGLSRQSRQDPLLTTT